MKQFIRPLLLLTGSILMLIAPAKAQKLSEGKVTYEVAYTENPEQPVGTLELRFRPSDTRFDWSINGRVVTEYFNVLSFKGGIATEEKGKKTYRPFTDQEIKDRISPNITENDLLGGTSDFAGYPCKDMMLTTDLGDKGLYKFEASITERIASNSALLGHIDPSFGFPLRFEMQFENAWMTLKAKSVDATAVPAAEFNPPAATPSTK
ncbi:MAG: hypothetical protein RL021_843 [Bacteroidota bacterium]